MPPSPALQTVLGSFGIHSLAPSDVVFLSGAGISVPSPTEYPQGWELHNLLLQVFTDLDDVEIPTATALIPFEVACQTIGDVYSHSSLSATVNVFWNLVAELFTYRQEDTWKRPNDLHAYFRAHLRSGGTHITANIDQYIELNEVEHFVRTTRGFEDGQQIDPINPTLYKFHGDCTVDFIGEQGFQFNAIRHGFSPAVHAVWNTLLSRAKLVVVCGYSGCDKFDVLSFFRAKPMKSIDCCALWLKHSDAAILQVVGNLGNPEGDMMLSRFRKGAVVEGLTGVALNELLPGMPRILEMRRLGRTYAREIRGLLEGAVASYAAGVADFGSLKNVAGTAIRGMIPTAPGSP